MRMLTNSPNTDECRNVYSSPKILHMDTIRCTACSVSRPGRVFVFKKHPELFCPHARRLSMRPCEELWSQALRLHGVCDVAFALLLFERREVQRPPLRKDVDHMLRPLLWRAVIWSWVFACTQQQRSRPLMQLLSLPDQKARLGFCCGYPGRHHRVATDGFSALRLRGGSHGKPIFAAQSESLLRHWSRLLAPHYPSASMTPWTTPCTPRPKETIDLESDGETEIGVMRAKIVRCSCSGMALGDLITHAWPQRNRHSSGVFAVEATSWSWHHCNCHVSVARQVKFLVLRCNVCSVFHTDVFLHFLFACLLQSGVGVLRSLLPASLFEHLSMGQANNPPTRSTTVLRSPFSHCPRWPRGHRIVCCRRGTGLSSWSHTSRNTWTFSFSASTSIHSRNIDFPKDWRCFAERNGSRPYVLQGVFNAPPRAVTVTVSLRIATGSGNDNGLAYSFLLKMNLPVMMTAQMVLL